LVGVDAVGPAAVGDDVGIGRELAQLARQIIDRHGQRSGDVPGVVFGRGADVEHDDVAAAQAPLELGARDRLQLFAIAEVVRGQALDLGDPLGRNAAQHRPQLGDPLIGQGVVDPGALAAGADQSGA
jgi:hypothetical protein